MVGKTVAIFTALEIKTPTGRVRPEQKDTLAYLQKSGARAGIARSVDDAMQIIKGL